MLGLPVGTKIFFCTMPVDFRKGIDGLVRVSKEELTTSAFLKKKSPPCMHFSDSNSNDDGENEYDDNNDEKNVFQNVVSIVCNSHIVTVESYSARRTNAYSSW